LSLKKTPNISSAIKDEKYQDDAPEYPEPSFSFSHQFAMTADTTGGGSGLTISGSSGDEDSSEYIILSRVAIFGGKRNQGVDKSVDIGRVESDNLDSCLYLCV
jgi:hypothetical protein